MDKNNEILRTVGLPMMYPIQFSVLRIVLGMIGLLPIRSGDDFNTRFEIADAIVTVTDDIQEQDLLTRIAYFESAFRKSVGHCSVRGDKGKSLGLFQLQPIEKRDARFACGSYVDQARLALSYIHRSADACPGNVGADRLAMYVSGTCVRGIREAKHRWGIE